MGTPPKTGPATGRRNPTAVFSLFTGRQRQLLTKTIILDEDGKLSKAAPQNAGSGHAETVRLPLSELSDYLGSLAKNQCLIHGTSKEGDNGPVTVVVDASRREGDGTISRTLEFFEHPDGPCLSMLDYDPGPDHEFTPEELIKVIDREVFPGFAQAATVAALSTSAEIYGPAGNLLSSPTPGFHLYFVARDGRDLRRFGDVLFKRLWLAGYGYGKLSAAGAFLKRGAIDASIYSPERCDFVAGAVLGAGLAQRRSPPEYSPGGYLDTSLLLDLTVTEEAEYQRLVEAERKRLKPQQEPKRRAYAASEAKRTGRDAGGIYKRLVEAESGTIHADTELTVKGGERMTIRAMVKAGMHLAYVEDPTERCDTWARLYIGGTQGTVVRSFLHGGTTLTVQGLTAADVGLSIHGVKPADLDGYGLNDSLEELGRLGDAPSVALAIVHKFAGNVPSKYSKADLLGSIAAVAPPIAGLAERLDWITSKHREEAVDLTAITKAERTEIGFVSGLGSGRRKKPKSRKKPKNLHLWPLPVKPLDGVTVYKAPHGVGKTQFVGAQFASYAKELGETFVATCHRRSLTHELARRLQVDNYQDVSEIRNGLAVCINSIIAEGLAEYCSRVENLFIDEFSQVLRHIADGSIRAHDRIKVYEALRHMITNAKRVIVADADLGDREIEFLEACRPGQRIRIFEAPADNSDLSVTYQHGHGAAKSAYSSILVELDAGRKVVVATDSRKKGATLETLIASELPDKKVLRVDADTESGKAQQAFKRDPNDCCVEYDIVIHSPSISSGVSIEVDHFDMGYGLFFGVIAPSDAVQMMRRARNLTTWRLAFDENNQREADDAAALVEGMEQAARSTATDFDEFRANYIAWQNKGCNNFARNMLYLLEASGFRSELIPATESDAGEAIKAAKDEVRVRRVQDIINAEDLEWYQVEDIRRKQDATYSEKVAVRRAYIKEDLKLPDLTVADIEFFDEGRGLAKLKCFELAANLTKHLAGSEGENLSLRNFDAVTARAYKRILAPLGIDLKTGEGSFGAEQSEAVVDRVMQQKVLLSYLGIVPNSVNYKRPKDSNKFIGRMLKLMGLKTSSRKKREEGVLVRRYYLDPDTFASIRKRAVRRRVGAELPRGVLVEDRWTVRHFRQITIQEIDEVPQKELWRLGIFAASEDDGYDQPEPPWRGCCRHLFAVREPSS